MKKRYSDKAVSYATNTYAAYAAIGTEVDMCRLAEAYDAGRDSDSLAARVAELEGALADICANYDRKGNTPESRRVQAARALLAKEGR